jgi:hypothetical protein
VQKFLEHVPIPCSGVRYAFSGGYPGILDVTGVLMMGPVEFGFQYHPYGKDKNGTLDWRIEASLKPTAKAKVNVESLTIGNLLADINKGS